MIQHPTLGKQFINTIETEKDLTDLLRALGINKKNTQNFSDAQKANLAISLTALHKNPNKKYLWNIFHHCEAFRNIADTLYNLESDPNQPIHPAILKYKALQAADIYINNILINAFHKKGLQEVNNLVNDLHQNNHQNSQTQQTSKRSINREQAVTFYTTWKDACANANGNGNGNGNHHQPVQLSYSC